MNEQEWLSCTDPTQMLDFLRERASDRKLLLFAVGFSIGACFPNHSEPYPKLREAFELSGGFADGTVGKEEARRAWIPHHPELESHTCLSYPEAPFEFALGAVGVSDGDTEIGGGMPTLDQGASLLRCVFGNPFRPVAIDPSWLTSDVIALAEGIYQDRAFDRLTILADALQDAGCDNAEVLDHCRGPGPHVRGCFVVDLLLGKE